MTNSGDPSGTPATSGALASPGSANGGSRTATAGGKGLGILSSELWQLVVAYLKQETITPLKALLRFVAFGLVGAVLLVLGGGLLTLAVVRALQVELGGPGGHLSGDWSWVPYVGGILFCLAGVGLAVSRIGKRTR